MTQLGNGGQQIVRTKPRSNIYTILVMIAALCLLGATIYVAWRQMDLYGSLFPPSEGHP